MSATQTETLKVERSGAVAHVMLNRPDVINAFNNEIRQGLPPILAELEVDEDVRAIVLSGAGKRGFCAGADIKETRSIKSVVEERRRLMPTSWIESLDRVSKPVIAAVHGICFGGGMELALACDIRVATKDATFSLPETALGLIPGGGGTQRLPRLIGLSRALDLLLTGGRVDGQEAHRIGLVTRLTDDRDSAVAEALRIAAVIGSRPPAAIAHAKEAAITGMDGPLAAGLALEKSLFALLTMTEDRAEAAAAFKEQRKPNFTGN